MENLVSSCCLASANGYEDYGICPDCREYTTFIDLNNLEEE